jgi:excisionase family DNA binding protein
MEATQRTGARYAPRAAAQGTALSGRETNGMVTAAQLAERWQVPVRTIYAWAKRNAIPHYRTGRLLRFDPVEVEEHFRRHGFAEEVAADPERPGESAFALLNT